MWEYCRLKNSNICKWCKHWVGDTQGKCTCPCGFILFIRRWWWKYSGTLDMAVRVFTCLLKEGESPPSSGAVPNVFTVTELQPRALTSGSWFYFYFSRFLTLDGQGVLGVLEALSPTSNLFPVLAAYCVGLSGLYTDRKRIPIGNMFVCRSHICGCVPNPFFTLK